MNLKGHVCSGCPICNVECRMVLTLTEPERQAWLIATAEATAEAMCLEQPKEQMQ
jgi:hypothetical protein